MGGKQLSFSDYELTITKNQQAKCKEFLAEIEEIMPWVALIALLNPILQF